MRQELPKIDKFPSDDFIIEIFEISEQVIEVTFNDEFEDRWIHMMRLDRLR